MNVQRSDISAHRIELQVTVTQEEMLRFCQQAATHLSEHTTIEGFRPGKAPYETVKARLGEMKILEEASRLAVTKTIDEALTKNITEDWVGQPQITVTKLAPDNEFEYKVLVTILPKVALGEYKNFGFKKEAVAVSDEEVQKVVDHLRESRVAEAAVDRGAEDGDKVVVDIEMFLEKVPLEGGQNKDTAVIIGKDYIVPGFDKNLIGLKKGETREFTIHYPAEHFQKNIAGKEVMFKVVMKDVFSRALPEVNDGFAAGFGLKSAEEFKANIKSNLEAEKNDEAKHKLEHKILEAVVAKATVDEIPELLIDSELDTMLRELEHNVQSAGGKFDEYLTSIQKSREVLREEMRSQAQTRVATSLVLREIIKAENITVPEADVETELDMLRKQYGHDSKILETLNSAAYRRHLETLLLNRIIISKLLDWNSEGV